MFAEADDRDHDRKQMKFFIDYMGSYHDPKRAGEEMKAAQESASNGAEASSTKVIYENKGFGKEPPPIVKMESEEQAAAFKSNFDKAMREKFGESYEGVEIVTPAVVEDDDGDDVDIIEVKDGSGKQ